MKVDDSIQQVSEILTSDAAKRVLVTSGKNVDPDALGSALAMAIALESLGKQVTVAIEEFDNTRMPFLPTIHRVLGSVGQKSLVVSIDVGQNPIEKINYNAEDTKFNLILTPKAGQVDVDQIQYSYAGLNFDAVVVVDTAAKRLLGDWVESFEAELKDLPIINIDHHADNEQFGTLNLVQADKASATMVVYELLQTMKVELTGDILTNLLAGVLSDTNQFLNRNADAASMQMAASMVEQGADLHGITKNLFKSMSVAALRLWGRVLSRVEVVDPGIVITEVRQADLTETQAQQTDEDTLDQITNTYIPSVGGAFVGIVLKEKDNGEISGSLRSIHPNVNVQQIAKKLNGGGHILASGFRLTDTTLKEAREKVIEATKNQLEQTSLLKEDRSKN